MHGQPLVLVGNSIGGGLSAGAAATLGVEGAWGHLPSSHPLAVLTAVPWSICFLSYSLLHLVYPADRKRALAAAEPGQNPARSPRWDVGMER